MLGNLIGGFITILVGITLLPTIADQVDHAKKFDSLGQVGSNLTGAAVTIIDLVTLFYALGIMSTGVAITAQGLRAAGMLS
jgi:uncharacterized membrane protein YhaH (DUF805 family)